MARNLRTSSQYGYAVEHRLIDDSYAVVGGPYAVDRAEQIVGALNDDSAGSGVRFQVGSRADLDWIANGQQWKVARGGTHFDREKDWALRLFEQIQADQIEAAGGQ